MMWILFLVLGMAVVKLMNLIEGRFQIPGLVRR
jgi:hypothetical protein